MLSVVMLSVVVLSVILPSVNPCVCCILYRYVEFHFFVVVPSHIILSYAACCYAKCHYAECRYAKWRGTTLSHFSLPLMFSYRLQSKNFLLILTLWSNKLDRFLQDRPEHASLFCKALKRQFCILMRLTLLGCMLCNILPP